MRKDLSDAAREESVLKKLNNDSLNSLKNPIRYGPGNYLVPDRNGVYRNSTLA